METDSTVGDIETQRDGAPDVYSRRVHARSSDMSIFNFSSFAEYRDYQTEILQTWLQQQVESHLDYSDDELDFHSNPGMVIRGRIAQIRFLILERGWTLRQACQATYKRIQDDYRIGREQSARQAEREVIRLARARQRALRQSEREAARIQNQCDRLTDRLARQIEEEARSTARTTETVVDSIVPSGGTYHASENRLSVRDVAISLPGPRMPHMPAVEPGRSGNSARASVTTPAPVTHRNSNSAPNTEIQHSIAQLPLLGTQATTSSSDPLAAPVAMIASIQNGVYRPDATAAIRSLEAVVDERDNGGLSEGIVASRAAHSALIAMRTLEELIDDQVALMHNQEPIGGRLQVGESPHQEYLYWEQLLRRFITTHNLSNTLSISATQCYSMLLNIWTYVVGLQQCIGLHPAISPVAAILLPVRPESNRTFIGAGVPGSITDTRENRARRAALNGMPNIAHANEMSPAQRLAQMTAENRADARRLTLELARLDGINAAQQGNRPTRQLQQLAAQHTGNADQESELIELLRQAELLRQRLYATNASQDRLERMIQLRDAQRATASLRSVESRVETPPHTDALQDSQHRMIGSNNGSGEGDTGEENSEDM
ncbi:hypothetical protein EJ05DRAFT_475672, partial [Pseudovirgaria hyperparasitica]